MTCWHRGNMYPSPLSTGSSAANFACAFPTRSTVPSPSKPPNKASASTASSAPKSPPESVGQREGTRFARIKSVRAPRADRSPATPPLEQVEDDPAWWGRLQGMEHRVLARRGVVADRRRDHAGHEVRLLRGCGSSPEATRVQCAARGTCPQWHLNSVHIHRAESYNCTWVAYAIVGRTS